MKLWFLFSLLTTTSIKVNCWQCTEPVGKTYSNVDVAADLNFSISPPSAGSVTYTLSSYKGTAIATIRYYSTGANDVQISPGYTLSGNSSGFVTLKISRVQDQNAGTYWLAVAATPPVYCNCLYILGLPGKPQISTDRDPSIGETLKLSCSSLSTTTPSNHSLNMSYNWQVNDVDNPANSRYTYKDRRSIVEIFDISKDDAKIKFKCNATEDVPGGKTSVFSDSFFTNVLYGPDNINFNPAVESYEIGEGNNLNDILCEADCNTCTLKWIHNQAVFSNSAVLSLGSLTTSKAGIYQCTASRLGAASLTKNLSIAVIYGPKNILILPSNTPTTVRQDEGSALSRTCSAQCWLCAFVWKGPNGFMSNISSLNIGTLNRSNNGQYTCTATNIKVSFLAQQNISFNVEVRYGPDGARLSPDNTSYTVDEMTSLSDIVCVAKCFPACTYVWTKQGQPTPVSATDTLEFGTVKKEYAGNYTCTASNDDYSQVKTAKSNVEVKIRYGPYQQSTTVDPPQSEHTINESRALFNIICHADCFPDCTYSWKKIGTDVILSTSGVLSLGSVNRSDAGMYICTAINPGKTVSDTTSKQVHIKVNYGPDTVNISAPQLYEIKEGYNVPDITCSSDCFPNCTFTWKSSDGRVNSSETLTLGKVTRQHAGSYTCTSKNSANAKTVSKTIQLVVQYAPAVSIRMSSSNVAEKSSLTLSCEGAGVPARYTYTGLTQTLGSVEIPNTNLAVDGTSVYSNIHFKSLQFQDTGNYTCRLNNGITDMHGVLDQSASVNLIVDVFPKVLKSDLVFAGVTDGSVTINIPFYCHPVVESIQFAKLNNTIIVRSEKYNFLWVNSIVQTNFYGRDVTLDGYEARMTISSLKEEDFGTYLLNISNNQGTTSVQFITTAESPPTTPKYFIYSHELDMPTLIWSKGFNGGHTQTFTIETAISDSGKWTYLINVSESDTLHRINESVYFANITGLEAGTYTARLTAWNTIGKAKQLYLNHTFTVASDVTDTEKDSTTTAAIVGGIVSAVVVLLIVAVILIVLKRRAGKTDKETSHLQLKKHGKEQEEDNNSDEDETIENPMYDRGPQQPVYSTPEKKKHQKELKLGDVYATVDKSKKSENNVVKKENPKKKKQIAQGDIYENVHEKSTIGSISYGNAAFEDNTYENPEGSKPSKTPKKNINPDGLIYADLAFNEQPKGQKKLVIHGLDEMTTYVQVDFNRKADPLPDSDTEEQSEKKKN